MKRIILACMVVLTMTGVACATVVLSATENASPGTGLRSFTVQSTGTGVTTLSQFTMTGDPVYQVWPLYNFAALGQTSWLADDATDGLAKDTYVIFGDLAIMDGAAWDGVGATPAKITAETNPSPTGSPPYEGWGTLDNYSATGGPGGVPTWDAYLRTGTPGTDPNEVLDLMQIVIADAEEVTLAVRVWAYEDVAGEMTAVEYVFEGVDALTLPWIPPIDDFEQGDTDGDGDIDVDDFIAFSAGWFGPDGEVPTNPTPDAAWATGDFDDNGTVDVDDFILFSGHGDPDGVGWFGPNGDGYAAGASVPEPSTIIMLVLGALCLIGYRRK